MVQLTINPGRERSLKYGHPWVFASALDIKESGKLSIKSGQSVDLVDRQGNFLARGAYSPRSQIRVRIWSFDPDEAIDRDFFAAKIEKSIKLRESIPGLKNTTAKRLIYGESDGLPGLIVDAYDCFLVVQFLTAGVEYWRKEIIEILASLPGYKGVFERSDVDVRTLEGLEPSSGKISGEKPPEFIIIEEYNRKYYVDIRRGQKTGFYLDQRLNRDILSRYTSGKRVLDCFCYTGGFTVAALLGGATGVIAIDESEYSLQLGRVNVELNRQDPKIVEWVKGDVFVELRKFRDRGEKFDLIVLDPPKFAPTHAQLQRALRGYKDINLLAMKLLNEDGILFTFSCSGGVSEDLFQKVVAAAGLDARVRGRIIRRLYQDSDHPVALNFPESNYLKRLIVAIEI